MSSIVKKPNNLEGIFCKLQQAPLTALREMLTDTLIIRACAEAGHTFRERLYGPVVTMFHFLLQAIQRDVSFAGTWAEIWSNAIFRCGIDEAGFNSSAIAQARARLPRTVIDKIVDLFLETRASTADTWCGFQLRALDGTTVSMPREPGLFKHFGAHKARTTTVRYPLATFMALLAVGRSSIIKYCFGPFDPGELQTATPLLDNLAQGDLLLADRRFSGSPSLAYIYRRKADFLMRKNARLIVGNLPVIQQLGRRDFITDITVNKPAREKDSSLPEKVRVRIFRATWSNPAGERLREWFVTSLFNRKRFPPATLARLYHERWRIETSFEEFKVWFHADVLRSKTVDNIYKEFAAHVLAYQLVRRLIVAAAEKHGKKPEVISFLHAARWTVSFSARMSVMPLVQLSWTYDRLLDAIASTEIDIRPGRLEPRALTRERKHYPHLRMSRSDWRKQRLAGGA